MKLLIAFLLLFNNPDSLQKKAVEENKNIVIYFSGSDWCTICHHFKKRVIDDDAVKKLLAQHFIYYTADFPQRKKLPAPVVEMNERLAAKFNEEGVFPKMVIADENYKVKAVIPNNASADEAFALLQNHMKQ